MEKSLVSAKITQRNDPPRRFENLIHAFPAVIQLNPNDEPSQTFEKWKETLKISSSTFVQDQTALPTTNNPGLNSLQLSSSSEHNSRKISIVAPPIMTAYVKNKLAEKGIEISQPQPTLLLNDIKKFLQAYFFGLEVYMSSVKLEFDHVEFLNEETFILHIIHAHGECIFNGMTDEPATVKFKKVWEANQFQWQASCYDLAQVGVAIQNSSQKEVLTLLLINSIIHDDEIEASCYGFSFTAYRLAIISLDAHRPVGHEFNADNIWPNCYRKELIEYYYFPDFKSKNLNPAILDTLGVYEKDSLVGSSPITSAMHVLDDLGPIDNTSSCEAIDGLILWRTCKTIAHELLHLMHLLHCWEPQLNCVMQDGYAAVHAFGDEQTINVCPSCLQRLIYATRYEHIAGPLDSERLEIERYVEIHAFCVSKKESHGFAATAEWIEALLHNYYSLDLVHNVIVEQNNWS
jgi:hypothetical protein